MKQFQNNLKKLKKNLDSRNLTVLFRLGVGLAIGLVIGIFLFQNTQRIYSLASKSIMPIPAIPLCTGDFPEITLSTPADNFSFPDDTSMVKLTGSFDIKECSEETRYYIVFSNLTTGTTIPSCESYEFGKSVWEFECSVPVSWGNEYSWQVKASSRTYLELLSETRNFSVNACPGQKPEIILDYPPNYTKFPPDVQDVHLNSRIIWHNCYRPVSHYYQLYDVTSGTTRTTCEQRFYSNPPAEEAIECNVFDLIRGHEYYWSVYASNSFTQDSQLVPVSASNRFTIGTPTPTPTPRPTSTPTPTKKPTPTPTKKPTPTPTPRPTSTPTPRPTSTPTPASTCTGQCYYGVSCYQLGKYTASGTCVPSGGYCCGNPLPTPTPTPTRKPNGQSCSSNSQCQSSKCCNATCQPSNYQCPQ